MRTRQHVNPLKASLQVPLEVADWAAVFADPRLPLAIDVGCGSGRFLLSLARRLPGFNLLGLDIRGPVRCQLPGALMYIYLQLFPARPGQQRAISFQTCRSLVYELQLQHTCVNIKS